MTESTPALLKLTDSLSGREAAFRLQPGELDFTLAQLLDKYLLHCPADLLLETGAIGAKALRTLQSMQDLVYQSDSQGRLKGMFDGVAFKQRGCPVRLDEPPRQRSIRVDGVEAALIELEIDRFNAGYHRNWAGFHRRRWNIDPDYYETFVLNTLERAWGPGEAEAVLCLDTAQRQQQFIHALGRRIWESDFENYSRFTGDKLMSKTGDETVRNIAEGAGGICAEKVQALKFLTDHYGLPSEYLIAGDGASQPVPVEELRQLLNTLDFRFALRFMRYWQHTALLYHICGGQLLVDATNGNIPFLFSVGQEVERLLGEQDKVSVPVRMVDSQENYYYHRTPQDIPENLFFAMEGLMLDTDMVQVFHNELGLYLSGDFYVMPLPYRSEGEYERLRKEYMAVCRRANFAGEVNREWTLDTPLGQELQLRCPNAAEQIMSARPHLLHRYNEWDQPGHDAGLVVFRLTHASANQARRPPLWP